LGDFTRLSWLPDAGTERALTGFCQGHKPTVLQRKGGGRVRQHATAVAQFARTFLPKVNVSIAQLLEPAALLCVAGGVRGAEEGAVRSRA
jgi:hypothetical protein